MWVSASGLLKPSVSGPEGVVTIYRRRAKKPPYSHKSLPCSDLIHEDYSHVFHSADHQKTRLSNSYLHVLR
jgi:hypothetical protein